MLVIASALVDLLARWRLHIRELGMVLEVSDIASLKAALSHYRPRILLLDLDLPGLGGQAGIAALRQLMPSTRIVVLGGPVSEDLELALFKTGVRGYCYADINPEVLYRVVTVVLAGELWIRRALVPQLLDALGDRLRAQSHWFLSTTCRIGDLTHREQQIAARVGGGESNKQIARQLDITERTVKAHLTEIFRKLGIGDRLKLALIVSSSVEH